MSDNKPVFVQLVELLGVAEAVANEQPVIVITIRPDPPKFWSHNIALTKDQAWRLATDLGSLLLPFVLLVCVLLATTGCGAKVEVESAKWDSSSVERARIQAEVDVLRPQRSEPVAEFEQKQSAIEAEEKSMIGSSSTTIIVNYRGGDTHNETHIHVQEAAPQRIEERVTVRREVQFEPCRQVDKRCQQLAREHEERVRKWREFPGG
ncbi:MAG: hypothetical protein ACYC4U_16020 [Pirellulaceae bacterium]